MQPSNLLTTKPHEAQSANDCLAQTWDGSELRTQAIPIDWRLQVTTVSHSASCSVRHIHRRVREALLLLILALALV